MPTNPVLDATGLTVLRTSDIRANLIEAIQSSPAFGEDAQFGADKALSQLVDAFSDELGLSYELLAELFDAWSPSGAEGIQLDNIGLLTGLPREPATASRVTLTLTGTPLATMPDPGGGRRARVADGPQFRFLGDVTFDAGGSADVIADCTETGQITATAGTITEIVDSHPDWSAVTNAADATPGENIETDYEYRVRRLRDIGSLGRCTDQAIRIALEVQDFITAARVISNRTLETSADGIPPKAFEPVVWPDNLTDAEKTTVFAAVWRGTPTGIPSHGTESATVIDSQGLEQTVKFSFGERVQIWIEVDVTDKGASYPANGDDLVEAAVIAYGATLSLGDDVLPDGIRDYVMPTDGAPAEAVPGVRAMDVRVKAGGAPGPGDTVPVVMTDRQYPEFDSARITVTS